MNESDQKAPVAWQPLTPRGVAAFAGAPLGRLLLVQLIVALLAAGVVAWCLYRAWFPVISHAIQALPAQGEIRSGRLDWSGASPTTLAEGRFLGIVVDLNHAGEARLPAHVQVEFGRDGFKVYSLFGYLERAYPGNRAVAFNRSELVPWWGAWAPPILAMAAGGVVVWLMVTWACLATCYTIPVWLIGFFGNRSCSLGGSWRLAGAALMPGALIMCVGILFYGLGALDLVRMTIISALHLAVAWAYLVISPLYLPPHAEAQFKQNPFG
jgi:hypothetical protein